MSERYRLLKSRVRRAGVTAKYWAEENTEVDFTVDPEEKVLNFFFAIPSKGGGETEVNLQIGSFDFEFILDRLSKGMPDRIEEIKSYKLIK